MTSWISLTSFKKKSEKSISDRNLARPTHFLHKLTRRLFVEITYVRPSYSNITKKKHHYKAPARLELKRSNRCWVIPPNDTKNHQKVPTRFSYGRRCARALLPFGRTQVCGFFCSTSHYSLEHRRSNKNMFYESLLWTDGEPATWLPPEGLEGHPLWS